MIEALPTCLIVWPWLRSIGAAAARRITWHGRGRPRVEGQAYVRSPAVLEHIIAVTQQDYGWDTTMLIRRASRQFERAARDGKIEVRGRPRHSRDYEIIKPDYWRTAELEIFSHMTKGQIPRTVPKDWSTGTPVYEDLVIERAQVERVWLKQ